MKILIPYIAFACLTGLTATSGVPVIAGGCSSHMNKKVETKCAEENNDCRIEKTNKFELNESIRS